MGLGQILEQSETKFAALLLVTAATAAGQGTAAGPIAVGIYPTVGLRGNRPLPLGTVAWLLLGFLSHCVHAVRRSAEQ